MAVELKRIPTHKKCKCKNICSQTRLVGQIYSSDVIMHRGYFTVDRTQGVFIDRFHRIDPTKTTISKHQH